MKQSNFRKISRRHFLSTTATAALAMPAILTGCASATETRRVRGPNDKINVGVIGTGNQGTADTQGFLRHDDCRVVAGCDVDSKHLDGFIKVVNEHYGSDGCKPYHDYRELIARPDIDAVLIALPDHWHEVASVEAARHGKDVYGEKPLAKTIAEQQAIVRAVQKNNIIWQTGSWQRSVPPFHKAAEIVRNGLIGKITHVEVGLPDGYNKAEKRRKNEMKVTAVPPNLDYDLWIGPSQKLPYIPARLHRDWRWNYNTGGGQLMDWIGHHCDIAHWGLGFDNNGPSEIEGHGDFPPKDAVWNACTKYRIECQYPDDIKMTIAGGYPEIKFGTKWIGTEGWVFVSRGTFSASNEDWEDIKELPEDQRKIKLMKSTDHYGNFLDSIRSRQPTIATAETAHHSAIPGHLGLISMLVGRKIRWNVQSEQILDDPEATKLLTRPFRTPYKI